MFLEDLQSFRMKETLVVVPSEKPERRALPPLFALMIVSRIGYLLSLPARVIDIGEKTFVCLGSLALWGEERVEKCVELLFSCIKVCTALIGILFPTLPSYLESEIKEFLYHFLVKDIAKAEQEALLADIIEEVENKSLTAAVREEKYHYYLFHIGAKQDSPRRLFCQYMLYQISLINTVIREKGILEDLDYHRGQGVQFFCYFTYVRERALLAAKSQEDLDNIMDMYLVYLFSEEALFCLAINEQLVDFGNVVLDNKTRYMAKNVQNAISCSPYKSYEKYKEAMTLLRQGKEMTSLAEIRALSRDIETLVHVHAVTQFSVKTFHLQDSFFAHKQLVNFALSQGSLQLECFFAVALSCHQFLYILCSVLENKTFDFIEKHRTFIEELVNLQDQIYIETFIKELQGRAEEQSEVVKTLQKFVATLEKEEEILFKEYSC